MMCGMCEAHVNEAIRGAFRVRKVASSHTKGECTVISENDISDEELKDAVGKTCCRSAASRTRKKDFSEFSENKIFVRSHENVNRSSERFT